MLEHLIIHFLLHYLKTKENFKLDLTWELWKTGRCGEVVAYERWLQKEVQL